MHYYYSNNLVNMYRIGRDDMILTIIVVMYVSRVERMLNEGEEIISIHLRLITQYEYYFGFTV